MAELEPGGIERRRSARTTLAVPLRILGQNRTGEEFSIEAVTHTVSDSGCLLHAEKNLAVDQLLVLRNEKTGHSIKGRVVSTWRHPNGKLFVGFEFSAPSQDFWPSTLPASPAAGSNASNQ